MSISSASAEKIEEAAAEIDVSDLRGAERKKAISRVVSDDEYKQLKSQYADSGWRPAIRNATVTKSQTPSETHLSVVIPFASENSSDQEEVNILWENSGGTPSLVGVHSINGKPKHTITTSIVESGEIVTKQSSILVQPQIGTNDNTGPGGGGGGGCPSGEHKTTLRKCNGYNWSCALKRAGAVATSISVCGMCGFGNTLACGACFGAITTTSGITVGCDLGTGCYNTVECTDLPIRS
jgi:hypothetical protein